MSIMRWCTAGPSRWFRVWRRRFPTTSKPWAAAGCMPETYIKVRDQYLYRAVDMEDDPLDFLLRAHRDRAFARRYFEKWIDQNRLSETVTIDGSDANPAALKRRTRPMPGFKDFRCVRILLGGIEVTHMIIKGKVNCARGSQFSPANKF